MMEGYRFSVEAMIRGHHVYKEIWTPVEGEVFPCTIEVGNSFQLGIVALESKLYHGDLALRFISFFTEEFAADIAVEGINVLRVPAGEGKVSSFECFPLIGRKYFNKDITTLSHVNCK